MNKYRIDNHKNNSQRFGSMTRQQIAEKYEWSPQTLKIKISQNGIELPKGSISPKWQKVIFEKLGYPPGTSRKDYEDV